MRHRSRQTKADQREAGAERGIVEITPAVMDQARSDLTEGRGGNQAPGRPSGVRGSFMRNSVRCA